MILLNSIQDATALLQDEKHVEKTLSIIELITSDCIAEIFNIGLLFVLLVFTIYIYFEYLFNIKATAKIDANFMNQIKDQVTNGKIDSAQILCAQVNSPVSRLIG